MRPAHRLLPVIALGAQAAAAHEDVLFTSSISYCPPGPEAILIQNFNIRYFAKNNSIGFDVTAASVAPNLSVIANVQLNQYGSNPVNITIDFCQVLGKALCPLPQYNFSGSSSIPLPSSLDVPSRVPTIAYKIPDLEAFAQVTLVDKSTGSVKACVQTTLSNGWSLRQRAVSWSIGAVALLGVILATYHILTGASSMAAQRLIDLFLFYQHICYLGMLNLNYPIVFISFTVNFSWAVGLFGGSLHLQQAIDSLRDHTGGNHDPAVSPAGTVNRKLSPYNDALSKSRTLFSLDVTNSSTPVTILSPADTLAAGIPTYTNTLQISERNTFMSALIAALILLAFAVLYFCILSTILAISRQRPMMKKVATFALCYLIVVTGPLATFSFYQWTLNDSWLSTLFSVTTFLGLLGASALCVATFIRYATTSHETSQHSNTFFNSPNQSPSTWHPSAVIVAAPLRAAFVGFGQRSGLAQVIGFLGVELVLLTLILAKRPYSSRGSNLFAALLGTIRTATTAMLIAFITSLSVRPIPRVVVGIVSSVLLSVGVVLLLFSQISCIIDFALAKKGIPLESISTRGFDKPVQRDGTNETVDELIGVPQSTRTTLAGAAGRS